MLFLHFSSSRPISTFPLLFFMLTPTACNVSKFSWFPSMSSWRRRNFLGKRFTFLATRELLVELKPGSFGLSSTPFCIMLLTNNLLSGRGGVVGLELQTADPVEEFCLTGPERACAECSCWIPHKEKKDLFPLPGPQYVRKARYLCGWIPGLYLWRDSTSWSNKWGKETVLWHREDPVKINALGTVSLNRRFSLVLSLLISHLSHSGISWAVCASSKTETIISETKHSGVDEWEHMTDHLKTWSIIIKAARYAVLQSSTVWWCK